ncbi:MAG: tetratricopeptide repeat protein [Opitutaceae bacterium]|nr:tetratricopeptide repeat protein [Opitutaceae bacterium]
MILLHLFYSAVPRVFDTPRIRLMARAACVALFAIVLAGAVSRGEDGAPTVEPVSTDTPAEAHAGRGNVSIVHVQDAPAVEAPSTPTPTTDKVTEAIDTEAGATADQPLAEPEEPVAHAEAGAPVASTDEVPAEPVPTPVQAAPAHAAALAPTPDAHASHDAAPAHLPIEASHGAVAATAGHARSDAVDDAAESARRFWQAGDYAAAEKAFTRALTANVPVESKRGLVLEMAGLYRGADQLTKAAAVLEKYIKTYPSDREVPQVLLELGAIYRDLGVYSMATARFFQVLNSTLRVSDEDIPQYRRLAMKARLEIAETYAVQGNLAEAEKYYSRLQLLELEPADRERVLLRAAQMQFTLKQWLAAEKALAAFVAGSPESPHLAEVRYMRAKALEELGRKQEAVDEVVALLQMPVSGDAEVARSTSYWKRRCANELANTFYERGDFLGALAIYQALARASMDPTWRWPAIYQIGLCFERMEMPQRAAEAYDAILAPETAPAPGARLPESLVSLQDMARWRRSHLVWIEDAGKQLQSLTAENSAGS